MNCQHCNATTTNGLGLCGKCRQTLSHSLSNVAAYHTDILRIQPGERIKTRSTYVSAPPPGAEPAFDPISAAAEAVDNEIGGWCRVLIEERPGIGEPPIHTNRRCGWLEHHIPSIATLAWGGQLLRSSLNAERRLEAILDEADTGWYAGRCGAEFEGERMHTGATCTCACHHGEPCDLAEWCDPTEAIIPAVLCVRPLYATPGRSWIRCRDCGTAHNVEDRREVMIREAFDELAPVAVLARAIVGMVDDEVSEERLAARLRKWVERGILHDYGVRVIDNKPRRVYRLGDVYDTLMAEKRAAQAQECGA